MFDVEDLEYVWCKRSKSYPSDNGGVDVCNFLALGVSRDVCVWCLVMILTLERTFGLRRSMEIESRGLNCSMFLIAEIQVNIMYFVIQYIFRMIKCCWSFEGPQYWSWLILGMVRLRLLNLITTQKSALKV